MTTARQIKAAVDDVLKQCDSTSSGDAALPEALIEPFEQLEKYASAFLVVFACSARTQLQESRMPRSHSRTLNGSYVVTRIF